MNAGNFCHPENPGSTHWTGCACHEARWAERLAASEERIATLQRENQMLWTAIANRDEGAPPPEAEKKGGEAPNTMPMDPADGEWKP